MKRTKILFYKVIATVFGLLATGQVFRVAIIPLKVFLGIK